MLLLLLVEMILVAFIQIFHVLFHFFSGLHGISFLKSFQYFFMVIQSGLSFFPFGKEVHYGGGAGSLLLNILWLLLSGLPLAIESAILGAVLCCTIIGIPFGLQHFKIAKLALMPFGAYVS